MIKKTNKSLISDMCFDTLKQVFQKGVLISEMFCKINKRS